jgi:hypothetical protein
MFVYSPQCATRARYKLQSLCTCTSTVEGTVASECTRTSICTWECTSTYCTQYLYKRINYLYKLRVPVLVQPVLVLVLVVLVEVFYKRGQEPAPFFLVVVSYQKVKHKYRDCYEL